MGAAIIFLVFLMAATVYANNQMRVMRNITRASRASAYYGFNYVPKRPRRPSILVWPSVMNPAVAEFQKALFNQYPKRYLRIKCANFQKMYEDIGPIIEPIRDFEIRAVLERIKNDELDELRTHAPGFFKNVYRELIKWLSGEAIECGFYTIFSTERDAIYRFIDANRYGWIQALAELAIILLQVIAVINQKTLAFSQRRKYQHLFQKWVPEWAATYEKWHPIVTVEDGYTSAIDYIQTVIVKALDIVTAWLFDYLTQRTREDKRTNWELSKDPGIVCALENYDRDSKRWDVGLYNGDSYQSYQDKINNMAGAFMTCQVKKGCNFTQPIVVTLGHLGRYDAVKIPSPEYCTHTCTDVTNYQKYIVYQHAHLTTKVGYDLHCSMEKIDKNDVNDVVVTMLCHPLIVEQYITARQIKFCKSEGCKLDCCKQAHLRPASQCEVVIQKKMNRKTVKLRETMTTFPDL